MVITRYNLRKHYEKYGKTESPAVIIAVVADLHDRCPDPVIEALRIEKPDLICVPGDLWERHESGEVMADGNISPWTLEKINKLEGKKKFESKMTKVIKFLDGSLSEEKPLFGFKRQGKRLWNKENSYHFLREASKIAPIVYSRGNHEWYLTKEDMEILEECRVELVDNCHTLIRIKGRELLIAGLPTQADTGWLKEFCRTDHGDIFKILLMHHPEFYDRYIAECDVFDLILSGHAHGGQWRILGRGIYAPSQGLFPKYHHGVYRTSHPGGALVVSAGCSNTTNIPRFGNPTELVMLKI